MFILVFIFDEELYSTSNTKIKVKINTPSSLKKSLLAFKIDLKIPSMFF